MERRGLDVSATTAGRMQPFCCLELGRGDVSAKLIHVGRQGLKLFLP